MLRSPHPTQHIGEGARRRAADGGDLAQMVRHPPQRLGTFREERDVAGTKSPLAMRPVGHEHFAVEHHIAAVAFNADSVTALEMDAVHLLAPELAERARDPDLDQCAQILIDRNQLHAAEAAASVGGRGKCRLNGLSLQCYTKRFSAEVKYRNGK